MLYYTAAFTHFFVDQSQGLIRLVHQFNQDECLWHSLEGQRRLRRKLFRLNYEQHQALDLCEYNSARPPDDCIGRQSSAATA